MSERTSFEKTMHRHEFRSIIWDITGLDMTAFYLEGRVRNLERRWPGKDKGEQHEFRLKRMRLRHELESLKIELQILERRASRWEAGTE